MLFVFDKAENIVGKGEYAGYVTDKKQKTLLDRWEMLATRLFLPFTSIFLHHQRKIFWHQLNYQNARSNSFQYEQVFMFYYVIGRGH